MEYCQDLATDDEREAVQSQILAQWREKYTDEQGRFTLYKAVGCGDCDDTGYRGRVGLHELLVASDNIKRAIITKMPIVDLTHLAINEGMRTLRQDGIDKVLQGLTDITRVRAVCIK
jgi:type II secretory ATPase GspE/PulE/Tfp pilus assembly ATPase PilB-like protein